MNTTPLAPGTYGFMHPYKFVNLTYVVSADQVEVFSVATRQPEGDPAMRRHKERSLEERRPDDDQLQGPAP